MGYLATQILAMATVLRDLVAGAGFGDFSMEACVAFSCAVLVFYCVTGGIIASVYTDLVQGLVMVAAAVLVFLATANVAPGGWSGDRLVHRVRRRRLHEPVGNNGSVPGGCPGTCSSSWASPVNPTW